ncbi:tyrosine-type recombinase/integrase [Niallia alba]|uniref:tyrosine-type recombinase/integrase n=1 Tax=Niallia alba TaxID=2729105 RepID=UPI0039A262D0
MEVIDFAREQLLSDLAELEQSRKDGGFNEDRLKLKLAGILSNYEIKRDTNQVFDSDIQEKVNVYLAAKRIEGLSEVTLKGYKYELDMFDKAISKKVADITSNDIRMYLSRFDNLTLSTIASKVWKLKSFFGWLHVEEIITRNPTVKVKAPKQERLLVKTLSIEEFETMREVCETLRQRTLIECMYSTACRLSELQQLNIKDINFREMSAVVYGKGRKEREVFFSVKSMYYLSKYLKSRNDDCEALFVTYRKPYRRVSNRSIQDEVHKIASLGNLNHTVTPHWFRRTMATRMLESGAHLSAVQNILGHDSPETTQYYINVTEEFKREQHKKYLPL